MYPESPTCCNDGARLLFRYSGEDLWNHWTPDGDYAPWVKFCPFCGADLMQGRDLTDRRIVFDVDGVVCNNSDPTVPYRDRKPYPEAVARIKRYKALGATIVYHTARYMKQFSGNQQAARDHGWNELFDWFIRHEIPCDELYLGKPSGDHYPDDRGCRLNSNEGSTQWDNFERALGLPCQSTTTDAGTVAASTPTCSV